MKIALPMSALLAVATLTLSACSSKEADTPAPAPEPAIVEPVSAEPAPRKSAVEITEIPLADVPTEITEMVTAAYPGFTPVEVLRKVRDGKTYFDVEGELEGGSELEFDVLMTAAGPEIVEIQRDIDPRLVPTIARKILDDANSENLEVVRVIESVQTEDNSIIYEVFVDGHPSDPTFEIQVDGEEAKLLAERAKH